MLRPLSELVFVRRIFAMINQRIITKLGKIQRVIIPMGHWKYWPSSQKLCFVMRLCISFIRWPSVIPNYYVANTATAVSISDFQFSAVLDNLIHTNDRVVNMQKCILHSFKRSPKMNNCSFLVFTALKILKSLFVTKKSWHACLNFLLLFYTQWCGLTYELL